MSNLDILQRYEELEAGRILGDLDPEEFIEWEKLSNNSLCQHDSSLEVMAAAIEAEFLQQKTVELPDSLLNKIKQDMPASSIDDQTEPAIDLYNWKKFFSSPQLGWAAAALIFIVFSIKNLNVTTPDTYLPTDNLTKTDPESSLKNLITKATDIAELNFKGFETYENVSGKVTWSDAEQEGYMTLTNLPVNDTTKNQYQLWIVDPNRDEKPVDGGVFNIPTSDSGTVIIPIKNALAVTNPQAFLITLEKPGGVVVSERKIEVALAATS